MGGWTPSVLAAALALALGAGCGDAEDGAPVVRGPSSTTSATTVDAGDRDGARWDFGIVQRIDRTEDGRALVVFDRAQLLTEDGPRSAAQLTEEPLVYGNTDVPYVNDNTRLRTFVLHPDADVLRLANQRDVCPDDDVIDEPRWEPVTVDEVVEGELWEEYGQVSLTFDRTGRVTLVRLATGC